MAGADGDYGRGGGVLGFDAASARAQTSTANQPMTIHPKAKFATAMAAIRVVSWAMAVGMK